MKKDIKLTNFEVKAIVNLLQRKDSIINSDKSYPISLLWIIDDNLRKLHDILVKAENMAKKIAKKYSDDEHSFEKVNEHGETARMIKPEFREAYNNDFIELNSITNEISISTIPYEDIEKFEITGKDFQSIRFMIEKPNYDEVKE